MTLPDKLLEKLVCPKCRSKLEYQPENERLVCANCRLAYRIVDDIPVLLVDEAENLK
ncbi:MAG TPA: Trm112 family protein [candidate division Zixibacteria bacterium]|nr:Trm112 family protein [candidate division Zixibacteria bacterium]